MFGLETLDVLIGLVTIYLIFGMVCTAIVETVTTCLNVRSSNLEAALNELFAGNLAEGKTFVKAFYDHPLVQALSKGENGRPSYIPPEIVGQVVESLIIANDVTKSLTDAVDALPGTPGTNRIKGLLKTCERASKDMAAKDTLAEDKAAFRKAVETQFNATMDRASGWFKRHTQVVALAAAATLVILVNVDTVEIANALASNPAARVKMVEIADQRWMEAKTILDQTTADKTETGITVDQAKQQSETAYKILSQATADMESAGLQLGWKDFPKTCSEFLTKIAGLLVSIFAISLGAPFWFKVLQGFMQLRATGASPNETKSGQC